MTETFLTSTAPSEIITRTVVSVTVFIFFALWEIVAPKRELHADKRKRWFINLTIIIGNSLLLRFIVPIFPVGLAVMLEHNNIGLLNNSGLPFYGSFIAGIIVLDLAIYVQHLMFHAVPLFWKFHMMHHADLGIDLTTGLRFHPVEIVLSLFIKLGVVYVFGISPAAVLVFEIILNGMSMFNHSNISIPYRIDKILRLLAVTPDMHRVHHSVTIRETNSNFGFNLSVWDRVFGTYRSQPAAGHRGMTIGLAQYRKELTLLRTLLLPFTGKQGNYAINRWGRDPEK